MQAIFFVHCRLAPRSFFFLNLVCEQRTVLRAKSESQEELTGANDQEKKSISWSLNGPSGRPSGSGDCLRAAREREMTQGHSGKPKKKKKKKGGASKGFRSNMDTMICVFFFFCFRFNSKINSCLLGCLLPGFPRYLPHRQWKCSSCRPRTQNRNAQPQIKLRPEACTRRMVFSAGTVWRQPELPISPWPEAPMFLGSRYCHHRTQRQLVTRAFSLRLHKLATM